MSGSPSQILPFLYLGDYLDTRNFEKLRKLGVSRILNVSDSARYVDEPEIGFCHIPISDYGETHLPAVFEQLRELEQRKTGVNTLTQDEIGPSVQEFLRTLQRNSDE